MHLRAAPALLLLLPLLAASGARASGPATVDDPQDVPSGGGSVSDVRTAALSQDASSTTLAVALEPTSDFQGTAFFDTDATGAADYALTFNRQAAVKAGTTMWTLYRVTASTAACQQETGGTVVDGGAVTTTVDPATKRPGFSVTVPTAELGGATTVRWALFGDTPETSGPDAFDYVPDATNPDPQGANPADRTCTTAGGKGRALTLSAGALLAPEPTPTPTPTATPAPPAGPTPVLTTPDPTPAPGAPVPLDASGSQAPGGGHIVAYEWDFNGDGRIDADTGTAAHATYVLGDHPQTIGLTVVDDHFRTASTQITLRPGAPPAGCVTEATIGWVHVRAACIRHDADRPGHPGDWHVLPGPDYPGAQERTLVLNGLDMTTTDRERPELTVGPRGRSLAVNARFKMQSRNTPLGDITWFVLSRGDSISLDHAPSSNGTSSITRLFTVGAGEGCGSLSLTERRLCAKLPGDFPLEGHLDVSVDTSNSQLVIDANVRLNEPITVSGRVRLRLDINTGLLLDSLHFGIDDATFGPVRLHPLAFSYEPPGMGDPPHAGELWNAAVGLELPILTVDGELEFLDGQFHYGAADVSFDPGIPVYAGIFLNRFAARLGVHPLVIGGGMGLSIAEVVQINGDWTYVRHDDGLTGFRLDGDASFRGTHLAHAYTEYWSDGYLGFGGQIGWGWPQDKPDILVSGTTDFWLQPKPGTSSYLYQGHGVFNLKLYGWEFTGEGVVNDTWIAGCAGHLCGAHNFRNGSGGVFFTGDLTPYMVQPFNDHTIPGGAARAAQTTGAKDIKVAAGQPSLALEIDGDQGAPDVTLTDPRGHVYTPSAEANKPFEGRGLRSIALPGGNRLMVQLAHPAGGTWTITPKGGSTAIARVLAAHASPSADALSAKVTGKGAARVLRWHGARLGGKTLQLVERGKGVAHVIATTRADAGSVRFTPQDGPHGRRTVEAQIVDPRVIPTRPVVVAHFTARGPRRAARPGRVRLRRRGDQVVATWPRSAAAGYVVRVTGSDGRRELHFVKASAHRLRIRAVAAATRLTVSVRAYATTPDVTGPARSARLAARVGAAAVG